MKYFFRFLAALLIAAFTYKAFAGEPTQYKGTWRGNGVYTLNGVQTYCRVVEMSFDGNEDTFVFLGGKRQCDNHTEVFARVEMQYKNGELFFQNQKVGELNDNILTSGFSIPESPTRTRIWRNSMRREGSTLIYDESRRMDDEVENIITFAGVLLRQP